MSFTRVGDTIKGLKRSEDPYRDAYLRRGAISQESLFSRYGSGLIIFHYAFMAISYTLTAIGSRTIVMDNPSTVDFGSTYTVFLVLSVVISALLYFSGTDFAVILLIVVRFYLFAVQGYGVGSFFFLKLLLGLGLLFESCLFIRRPLNLLVLLPLVVGLAAVQIYNPFFGHYGRQAGETFASWKELASLTFIWSISAALMAFAIVFAEDLEKYRKSFSMQKEGMQVLTDLNIDLQTYARRIDHESSERERNRISRELHDISGYIFTNLIVMLDAACSTPPEKTNELSDILIKARSEARQGLNETRSALRKIRAIRMPEEEGLRAINTIINNFRNVTGINIEVSWGNTPASFSRKINFVVYRTVQEAMINAFKHGMATEISLHFLIADRRLRLTISDNGRGSAQVVKGIGMAGMEERIGALGGSVRASGEQGKGFSLKVEIPLEDGDDPNGNGQADILPT